MKKTTDSSYGLDNFKRFYGFLGDDGESGVKFENRIRRSKKETAYVVRLRKGL